MTFKLVYYRAPERLFVAEIWRFNSYQNDYVSLGAIPLIPV